MTTHTPSVATDAPGDLWNGARSDGSHLDLMHPDGAATRMGGIGRGSEPSAALVESQPSSSGSYDALDVTPDTTESTRPDWLRNAVCEIDRLLSGDGVAYVRVPRRLRRALMTELERTRLSVSSPFIHVHYGSSAEYLVQCDATALGFLASSLPMPAGRERLLRAGLRLPKATSWLTTAGANIGFAVQRKGARPLFEWATSGLPDRPRLSVKLVRIKQRGRARSAVLWLFGEGQAAPWSVVKTALNTGAAIRIAAELDNLGSFRASVADSGATLPTGASVESQRSALRLGFLDGLPADVAIGARPDRHRDIVQQVTTWLARWHDATRTRREIDTNWLLRELIDPAHALRHLLDSPEPYFRWLAAACARLTGRTLGLVACHGDLTMSNLVVDGSRSLGIVDWESARADGLPLSDLFYAAADARAAAGQYKHRAEALIEAFTVQSDYGRFVAGQARIADPEISREPEIAQVLLHATALHHAVNEQAKGRGNQGPFASLLRALVSSVRTWG